MGASADGIVVDVRSAKRELATAALLCRGNGVQNRTRERRRPYGDALNDQRPKGSASSEEGGPADTYASYDQARDDVLYERFVAFYFPASAPALQGCESLRFYNYGCA